MAKQRKKSAPKKAPVAADPQPFNNPFSSNLKTLRKELRAARAAREADAAKRKPRREPARTAVRRDDREEFFAAIEGSTPMSKSRDRVRSGARAVAATVRADERSNIDFTADEHFDMRFSDRYIRASAAGVSKETVAKLERGEFAVRSHVDLHGMALDDARRAVDEFLSDRHRHGERCVLVITGKGRNSRRQVGVLREKIPEWLARGPSARRVLAFVTARPCDGGEGALYVLLRKHAAAKARIDVLAGSGA